MNSIYRFRVSPDQLESAERTWRATLGTNTENHAVSITRTAKTLIVRNESRDKLVFEVK